MQKISKKRYTRRNIGSSAIRKTQKSKIYSKEDFISRDGMLTTVWGPMIWSYLHCMSFNYPNNPTNKDKKHYRDFVLNLQNVLPCGKCRNNLKNNLKRMPLTMSVMSSRDTFSRYVYNLHEVVNKMLGKKSNLTYEEIRETFEHFRARCSLPIELKHKNGGGNKEDGCIQPLYGKKAKCILKIVPQEEKCTGGSFQVDKKCVKQRIL